MDKTDDLKKISQLCQKLTDPSNGRSQGQKVTKRVILAEICQQFCVSKKAGRAIFDALIARGVVVPKDPDKPSTLYSIQTP